MAALGLERFLARLAKGKPVAAILLLGDDLYLRDLCRAALVTAYVPENGREWGVARFSLRDSEIDRILERAQTAPMLAPRQVVFVGEIEVLEKLADKARDAAIKQLTAYLEDPAPFTVLVLEAAALDQRMKLFKTLREQAQVVALDPGQASPAVATVRLARELGVEIDRDAAEQIAELLNGELARIRMELEKLATFVGERKRITSAEAATLVISAKKYSVWNLADMVASGEQKHALVFLDSVLREGDPAPAVVGAIAWMYRRLIEAQDLPPHLPGWQAARELGVRAETAELAMQQARRIPRQQLLAGLVALYEADNRLKSGKANERAVMEFLVTQLTARRVAG